MTDHQQNQQPERDTSNEVPLKDGTPRASQRTSQANSDDTSRRTVNVVLQGKGGIGKTVVASLIAQCLRERSEPVVCIDTDPVNSSFAAIKALGAEPVRILAGDRINVPALNGLAERILTEDAHFVIDGGAASFLPLTEYLIEAQIFDLLASSRRVVVHMPVIGGRNFLHSVAALTRAAKTIPAAVEIAPWFNGYFGPLATSDGVPLEETELYVELSGRLSPAIRLPQLHPDYAGAEFARMLDANRTFAEARDDQATGMIPRMWLEQTWAKINAEISVVL